MKGQMTIFDWMPTIRQEPDVGEFVEECGAVIPHIMRKAYIGKKVLMDYSTQGHTWFKCGILEKVIPAFYWSGDKQIECDRSIVYDGKKQRCLITHYPGHEIFECLPFDAYAKRNAAIGKVERNETE